MVRAQYPGPAEALDAYAAAVEASSIPELKGAKNPYTSRNGHMFSFLDSEGNAAIRLSEELVEAFAEEFETGPVQQYGATMRGYASVPDSLLTDSATFAVWLDRSHDWIGTLPPKPTTK